MLFHFQGENSRVRERHIAVCLFDDLVEFGGSSAVRIYQNWVQFVINCVNDANPAIRQAAAYGTGLLAEHSPELFLQILPTVINRLNAVITHKDSRSKSMVHATENAISAIGKIIQFHAAEIDVKQVLMIWLSYLPVSENSEAVVIYQQLCTFFVRHTEIILGENFVNLPKILGIFADILGTTLITPATFQTIVSILKQMQAEFPAELMQSAWLTLNPSQQCKSFFLLVLSFF